MQSQLEDLKKFIDENQFSSAEFAEAIHGCKQVLAYKDDTKEYQKISIFYLSILQSLVKSEQEPITVNSKMMEIIINLTHSPYLSVDAYATLVILAEKEGYQTDMKKQVKYESIWDGLYLPKVVEFVTIDDKTDLKVVDAVVLHCSELCIKVMQQSEQADIDISAILALYQHSNLSIKYNAVLIINLVAKSNLELLQETNCISETMKLLSSWKSENDKPITEEIFKFFEIISDNDVLYKKMSNMGVFNLLTTTIMKSTEVTEIESAVSTMNKFMETRSESVDKFVQMSIIKILFNKINSHEDCKIKLLFFRSLMKISNVESSRSSIIKNDAFKYLGDWYQNADIDSHELRVESFSLFAILAGSLPEEEFRDGKFIESLSTEKIIEASCTFTDVEENLQLVLDQTIVKLLVVLFDQQQTKIQKNFTPKVLAWLKEHTRIEDSKDLLNKIESINL